jgi:hypothetical protein
MHFAYVLSGEHVVQVSDSTNCSDAVLYLYSKAVSTRVNMAG